MTPCIRFTGVASLAAILSLPLSTLAAQDIGPPAPADAAPGDFSPLAADGVEVMTRGVVHEAFAEVVTDPKPGLVVSKRPPEAIEEVPPEFKPEEEGAIWVTGYWAWDDERDDFFWQSGVWRVPPPGMRWVAGYWNEVPGGWQWISGFWLPVETEEIRYYAAPPASLEAGPTGPSPGDNYFWATGSWTYNDTDYRWQPGYWAPYQENWVWISPRYAWTPAGCVYLPGRWDYRLTRRGCLFAPVYFAQPVYLRPNYVYRPWCALNTPNLFVHLWVRPNYGHFYFGNYYGSNWGNWGVTPWCQYRPYRNCYDPMLTQLQCHYRRSGVNYINRLDGWHNHYASNVSSRPPRTWNEQVRVVNKTNINNTNVNITNIKQNVLAVNLKDADRRNDLNMKFARLDGNMQKQAVDLAKETRDVRQQRISIERPAGLSPDLVKGETGKRDGNQDGSGGRKSGRSDGDKPSLGQRGPRPSINENVRLKLPATHVSDSVKEKEKLVPPKPKQTPPIANFPEINKRRGDSDEPKSLPGPTGVIPEPKVDVPATLPKTEGPKTKVERRELEPGIPRPQTKINNPGPVTPKVDIPKLPPKVEIKKTGVTTPGGSRNTPGGTRTPDFPSRPIPSGGPVPRPGPDGNFPATTTPGGSRSKPGGTRTPDFPSRPIPPGGPVPRAPLPRMGGPALPPQPKAEMLRPGSRIDSPRPQPKLESSVPRLEPRERPQIKLDIPRPSPRMDPVPRVQVAPRVETQKPEAPKNEPRRGGENHPRGGRNKPE